MPVSVLVLPTSPHMHGPLQPQANIQRHPNLEHGLDQSTGVHDGIEHQDNDSRPEKELLMEPSILDINLFDWKPDQNTLFQDP